MSALEETAIEEYDEAAPAAAAAVPPPDVSPRVVRLATGPRRLGVVQGPRPGGPTLLVTGSLHGNEPAGTLGLERVFRKLDARALRGVVAGFVGNRQALARGLRFIDSDLNRAWIRERVEQLRDGGSIEVAEDVEIRDLDRELRGFLDQAQGPVYLLDLHTTSGPGPAFANLDDSLPNRRFGLAFPVPLVVGLEENLAGTLTSFLGDASVATLGFEAGQHQEPAAVERAESAVWIALEVSGVLAPGHPEAAAARRRLTGEFGHLPHFVEVLYRHAIQPGDGFRMMPGFSSFQVVERDQVLAMDRSGEVRAREAGLILMPLYQRLGAEGFFVIRPLRDFWLWLSEKLRRLHQERVIHWLPGVRRHDDPPGSFRVDRRVARFLALELFHLLGYKREREHGSVLVMRRRIR